jgi:uncharacterized membrane protein YgcG
MPVVASPHDDEFDSDWGWIDEGPRVEEYEFENGDVSVDMSDPGSSVSFETFEDGLEPHGQWVTVGSYGRVWRPIGVHSGWRPYYNGRWEWTHEGWLWVSAEPWGWATYHYGRWAFDSFHGWVWVPGYQWAPAWVSWRFGADYIGWAPLGPGVSVYVTNYPVVYDRWCFVPSARFVGVPVHSVAFVGHRRVAPIFSRTQPAPPRARVNGATAPAWGGPARPFVEKRAGRTIAPVRVQPVASPSALAAARSREGVIPVYRPEAARPSRPGSASRSGAATAPGRARSSDGAAASRSNAITAPPRSGTAAPAAPSRSGAVRAPPRSGEGGRSQAAPARPGASGSRGGSSSRAVQPPPAAAPPAAAPAPSGGSRSDGIRSGGSPSAPRGGSAPRAAPPSRGSFGGGSSAAPPRGGSGGASRGGAAASSGGGGARGGGHAVPNRR